MTDRYAKGVSGSKLESSGISCDAWPLFVLDLACNLDKIRATKPCTALWVACSSGETVPKVLRQAECYFMHEPANTSEKTKQNPSCSSKPAEVGQQYVSMVDLLRVER